MPAGAAGYDDVVPADAAPAFLLALSVVGLGYAADRGLRWMGRRGWIFYGSERTAPLGSRSATALMELDSLFTPAVEHVIEYRRYGDLWSKPGDADGGRPPAPEPPGSGDERPLA